MVGTLAQLIALASFGNAYLDESSDVEGFYPSNSTFQFCNEISFVEVKKFLRVKEKEVAKTPNHWFNYLRTFNCRRLTLKYAPTSDPLPDHISSAFVGGGGKWYIVSGFFDHADYWLGRWEVTDQEASDNKIWKVTYGKAATREQLPQSQASDLSSTRANLEVVLQQIKAFAQKHELDGFAGCFRKGLGALSSNNPISLTYHNDLLPTTGYNLDAKQLIAAASEAWVFGGMGSWNDLSFDNTIEHQEYERLSRELYAAINVCVERSVNSFDCK